MRLQAIYEPVFKDTSHGFRPERSGHTALLQIKTPCKGTNWVMEGDIEGCFDTIDHPKRLQILARTIADGRFLKLIGKFLKAGYLEFRQVHYSLTGTPQGGMVSPILANLYRYELDVYLEAWCRRYTTQRTRRRNAAYQAHNRAGFQARKNGDSETADTLLGRLRTMQVQDPLDPDDIKVQYCR
jgi:retron-type reverse transcriptase